MMFPLESRRGIFVVETQVTWPSGQVSFSSIPHQGLASPDNFLPIDVSLLGMFRRIEIGIRLAGRLAWIIESKKV